MMDMTIPNAIDPDSRKWLDWIYMSIFLVILAVTWLLNLVLLLGIQKIKRAKEPHFIIDNTNLDCKLLPNYYFIISISIANILAVSLNPPIFIVSRWLNLNHNSLWRTYCLVSISSNTIFCNLAFLHVLFASLDTFLRLFSPRLYIFSQRRSTSLLKISAPWLVTGIQAGCQLSISNLDNIRSKNSQCMIDDVNFLILRSVISFTVPLVACVILTILQILALRKLANITDENLRNLVSTYLYRSQIPEATPMNPLPDKNPEKSISESKINYLADFPRDLTRDTLVSLQSIVNDPSALCFNPIPVTFYPAANYSTLQTGINKVESRAPLEHQHTNFLAHSPYVNKKRAMWNFVYRREQMSVALNMATCIVAIGIWSPLILSTLTYRLCEQSACFFQIPAERISDFQWWSFAGGAVYPFVYMCLDRGLRHAGLPLC